MNVSDAIAQRRSIKKFQDRPIPREDIEALLDAAVLAPNHHLSQPWRFHVLGPAARRAYGLALGDRKARKVTDPAQAAAVREKTGAEHEAFPALIAKGPDGSLTAQAEFERLLEGVGVLRVGVHCALETLEAREATRGDRGVGTARRQFATVHAHARYDVEVDTSAMTLDACVGAILAARSGGSPPGDRGQP